MILTVRMILDHKGGLYAHGVDVVQDRIVDALQAMGYGVLTRETHLENPTEEAR